MKIQEYDKEVSQLLTKAKAGDDRDWIEGRIFKCVPCPYFCKFGIIWSVTSDLL